MEDINITLETLYDILRNEKKREDLQKLEDTFFFNVVSYLKEKKSFLEMQNKDDNPFAANERDKLEYELRSIQRILKEIYEKREKKIIDITLNRSRTGSDIIDTSAMLREEKEFYQRLLEILDGFRNSVLLNLFNAKMPELPGIKRPEVTTTVENSSDEETENEELEQKTEEEKSVTEKKTIFNKFEGLPEKQIQDPEKSWIEFIHPVPSFVWKDMKVYGPYDAGEKTEIFSEVAELLIRKGRAKKV